MTDLNELRGYLDKEQRLSQWPSKATKRMIALRYLSEKFESDRAYSEREVNEVLKAWHTFSDWALLRREMVDNGYFKRSDDCMEYWQAEPESDKVAE